MHIFAALVLVALLAVPEAWSQVQPNPVPSPSVNMVSGTQFPGGDPFLQRQNEPSMGVSSRNSLHLLGGANDYRTVDLPGVPGAEPTGDAWLGLFRSLDGGRTWRSTLIPGYPQDTSAEGLASPLKGLQAAADPIVRPGANGLFFYSGLAFNRSGPNAATSGPSKVFVSRFIDDNNVDSVDTDTYSGTIRYIGTTVVDQGDGNHFEDKPSIAVDRPRGADWQTCTVPGSPAQTIPMTTVYMVWTEFSGPKANNHSAIRFSYSTDCGVHWRNPKTISGSAETNQGASLAVDPITGNVYITWRVFAGGNQPDAIMFVMAQAGNGIVSMGNPVQIATLAPFDQGTTTRSFRTNAYPAIAADGASRVYVSWSQRGNGPGGDARMMLTSWQPPAPMPGNTFYSPNGINVNFPPAVPVENISGRGHQIMPAMAFSSGRLSVAWYDLRFDDELQVVKSSLGAPTGEYPEGPALRRHLRAGP